MAFSSAPQVEMQTSIGTIVVELYVKHAPKTCKNFRELARRGYYNNTVVRSQSFAFLQHRRRVEKVVTLHRQHALSMQCHRIIKDFMIQAGDPTGRLLVLHNARASTLLHAKKCTWNPASLDTSFVSGNSVNAHAPTTFKNAIRSRCTCPMCIV